MSANSSTGSSAKGEKFVASVASALADAIMKSGGVAAVERKGVEVAAHRASESSGKGAAKNAKRLEEERLAHEQVIAAWKLALVPWNKYVTEETKFFDAGNHLPFVIPPPNPGPHPGPFVSSAEKNRLANEARALANKAKMVDYTPSLNSSCSASLPPAGPSIHGLALMKRQQEREEAILLRAAQMARMDALIRVRRLAGKMEAWAQSIHRLEDLSVTIINDPGSSLTQKNKYKNILRFLTLRRTRLNDTTRPYVRPDVSLIGFAAGAGSRTAPTSNTLHFSSLPGPFNHREMTEVVLPALRKLVARAAPELLGRKSGHRIVRNKIAMRDGWSSGYGFIEVESPELAAAIVDYLKMVGAEITADCYDMVRDKKTGAVKVKHFGMRTAAIEVTLATTLTQRTPQQQREYEEALRDERRRVFHENARNAREAQLAAKRAEQEWKASFISLPGASVVAPVAQVGPSLRDQLLGLAERRAAAPPPRPAHAGEGWVDGVFYDVLNVQNMLAQPHAVPEPEETVFDGIEYKPTAERPIRVETVEAGWSHVYYISVEEARARLDAEEAAAKVVATAKAKARVAARAVVVTPVKGKNAVLSAFFRKAVTA